MMDDVLLCAFVAYIGSKIYVAYGKMRIFALTQTVQFVLAVNKPRVVFLEVTVIQFLHYDIVRMCFSSCTLLSNVNIVVDATSQTLRKV